MSSDLAPIATQVIYEDDHVRVWNQVVPAGATIEKHVHEHDYVLLNVAGEGPIDVRFHAGTGGELGDRLTFSPQPRSADFVRKGHIETARNDGDEYRAILVEFKRDGAG
tara:strand:+ start:515 stop:841 length:327 start_codon:yes stop_codon:yes gene_type:complete